MKRRNIQSKIRERITFSVRTRPGNRRQGLVLLRSRTYACALGTAGIRVCKREGDGSTPAGCWKLLGVLYRADRVARPVTALSVNAISGADGWCDAPNDRNYNSPVKLPYPRSAEEMWREDSIYDIVVILDHNTRPRKRCRGSAVFIHLSRKGYSPTQGCIALGEQDLRMLLQAGAPGSTVAILP